MRPQIFILIMVLTSNIYLSAQNQIPIPESITGTDFSLTLQQGSVQFYDGQTTSTMGVNGNILGPTLIMQKGDFVNIDVLNQLDETTTIHWHGMHVSASNDGGPHTTIAPSANWNPSFMVMDRAATYWYHPHLHEKTNEHVSKGIAGFIIVRDADEAALQLPRSYGVDDFPLVIQTKEFDADNQIVTPTNSDNVLLVNATIDPELDLPAQVVRLRLLNGSSQRVFQLGFSDNRMFFQIATDDGLLSEPNEVTRLRMAPGERAEILVDLAGMQGQTINLMSYASELPNGIYGATLPGLMSMMTLDGYNPNPMNGADFEVLTLNLIAPTSNPVTTVPATLVEITPLEEGMANASRTLTFTPEAMGPNALNGKFFINGVGFDMNTINYSIPLNNIEVWTLSNQSPTAHPFHIHDVHFYILDRGGVPPQPGEQGRKDVILVPAMQSARVIMQFTDFANDSVPYMYHCHMLTHEDGGMMGQFKVVDEQTGISNRGNQPERIIISPNPVVNEIVSIDAQQAISKVILYNASGRQAAEYNFTQPNTHIDIDISNFAAGVYYLQVFDEKQSSIKKMIKQ